MAQTVPYSDAALHKCCTRRLAALRNKLSQWVPHWRLLSDHILPRRGQFLVAANVSKGERRNQRILDSTGTLAARTLTAGMMSGVTSPARPWFKLSVEGDMADNGEVKQWLDTVASRMLLVFAKSNFYNQMHVFYEELSVFGTAVLIVENDFEDVLRFRTLSVGEYMIAENARGKVDVLYREYNMTVGQLVEEFGKDAVTDTTRSLHDNDQLDTEVAVVHAIEPNDKQVYDAPGAKGMPYRSLYWEKGATDGRFLRVGGFKHFPALCVRWHLNGTDTYGRSPGMDALPDVQQLQVEQKRKAQGIDKMVNPPMVGSPQLKNQQASSLPGGMTYLDDPTGKGFRPAYMVTPQIGELKEDIAEVQERIKEAFYVPLFLMLTQLDGVQPRNEMEISERKEEKLLALGPVLERMDNEAFDPLVDIAFARIIETGLVPQPPQALHGQPLGVEYISTLHQAQKAVATAGIERLAGFVGSLASANPEVLDKFDTDEAIDEYGTLLNVPAKIIVPQEVVDKKRAARAQQAQQAQAMQQTLAGVQGAKTLSETQVGAGQNALSRMIGVG